MMTIRCETMEQFITVCAGLVRESVTFVASADTLVIKLTGGY